MADSKKADIDARLKELARRVDELAHQVARQDRAETGEETAKHFCGLPEVAEREFGPEVSSQRAELIRVISKKWVNGTNLHYYFFDNDAWGVPNEQRDAVRNAFQLWKEVGLGLEFTEVFSREDAEIRIGYTTADGSWSYVGRDVFIPGANERTMSFGWDLTTPYGRDTAIHEIGHTLGFPHEHQNPNAGIVWDEEAVYRYFEGPPNYWSRGKTYHNVIRKIEPDSVEGSNWDPDSIMHYQFRAGLIEQPAQYQTQPLIPAGGLSDADKEEVRFFYPPLAAVNPQLKPFQAEMLSIGPGEQRNFNILPSHSRYYRIQTFGESDTVMVLFEDEDGDLVYVSGDDDSGTGYNANMRVRLNKNRKYVLRIRLYYQTSSGDTAVMMW